MKESSSLKIFPHKIVTFWDRSVYFLWWGRERVDRREREEEREMRERDVRMRERDEREKRRERDQTSSNSSIGPNTEENDILGLSQPLMKK